MAPLGLLVFLICIAIPVGLYLLFRLAFKLSVLSSICMVFLIMPIPAFLGIRSLTCPSSLHIGYPYVVLESVHIALLYLIIPAIAAVILMVQFLRWVAGGDHSAGGVVTSEERQKTLKMVAEGKISSREASELLDALGRSSAMRGQDTFSRLDIMTLVGIGLVVLGFFLPWVFIRMPGLRTSAYQAGSDYGAVGWAVLVISMLAALPVFITPKDYLYKMSLLQMFLFVLGGVITISLLVQAVQARFGPGLLFCLAGYVLAAIASFVKFKKLSA